MEEIKIYNALSKIDDDLIDSSLKRKANKRPIYGVLAVSFVLLVSVVAGVYIANFEHKLTGDNGLILKNTETTDQSVSNPDEYQKIIIQMDWPFYNTAEGVVEASSHIYSGTVTDISFTILDGMTGVEDFDPESESASRMFYTVYTIEITDSYKGANKTTAKIATNGGLSGIRESEQFSIIRSSGLRYNGIPVTSEKIELSIGQSYLFCTHRVGDFDHIINPEQFAFELSSKDAKTIIACCK